MQPVSCFSGIEAVLGECGGAWAGTCNHTTGSCSCAAGWSGHSDVLPMDLSQWGGSVLACHVHVPTVKVICRRGAGCRTRSGFGERVVSRRHSWGYLGTSCGLWDSVGHEWSLSVHRISCQATEEDVGIAFMLYPLVPPPLPRTRRPCVGWSGSRDSECQYRDLSRRVSDPRPLFLLTFSVFQPLRLYRSSGG